SRQESVFIEMQTWLFVLKAGGKKPSNQMDDKIGWAAVTRMLNLRNILELVNDGLNDGSFAQQQFVREGHKMILHVLAQSGDEMQALFKEQLGQGSGNVAAVSKQLPPQSFHHLGNRSPIIDIARRQATRQ